jgi:hypothetical protein
MKGKSFFAALMILFSVSLARGNTFSIEAGGEWMYGYTLYRIGGIVTEPDGSYGTVPFPVSELDHPVSIFLATIKSDWSMQDKFDIVLNIKQSVSSNSGQVEDSDWGGYNGYPPVLIGYSTSDSSLDFFSIDSMFLIKFYSDSGFSASAGPGFLYQYFYYTISDLNQSGSAFGSGFVPGEIGTYQLNEFMLYGAIELKYSSEFIGITALFGLSPALCNDYDNHMLRSLQALGSSAGIGTVAQLDISKDLSENIFLDLKGGIIYVLTSGTQSQSYYASNAGNQYAPAGPNDTIGYSQQSMQYTAGLDLGIRL